jgi:hypothetical protein
MKCFLFWHQWEEINREFYESTTIFGGEPSLVTIVTFTCKNHPNKIMQKTLQGIVRNNK